MYQSLERAALTAIALSAAAWVLFVAVGRQLVAVPVVPTGSVTIAQTIDTTRRSPSRVMRLPTAAQRAASSRATTSSSLPVARRVRQ